MTGREGSRASGHCPESGGHHWRGWGGKNSPGFVFSKDKALSGYCWRTDRALGMRAGSQLGGCGRRGVMEVRTGPVALETELSWMDFDDGISQGVVKDLLPVGEERGEGV